MVLNSCFRFAPVICKTDRCLPLIIKKMNFSFKIMRRPDLSTLKMPTQTEKDIPLALKIGQRIKLSGPLTVADYMKEVLTSPSGGYYTNKDMFGASGDFITSPEVCQIFGDIIGVWLFSEWKKLSMPKPLQLVEFGPGRGTLISDVLKITKQLKLDKTNLSIHLVEVSPTLQRVQGDMLCLSYSAKDDKPYYAEGETLSGCKVYWYKDFKDVPKNFSLYIAHEFFDALPIHKFKRTEQGWREILIDLDSDSKDLDNPKFRYVLSREETRAVKVYVEAVLGGSKQDQLEVSPQSLAIAKEIANRVEENGGIALIVDYGHDGDKTDTFRAFKKHQQSDPLQDIGSSDLTADVDFSQLRRAASEARVLGPITQKDFLEAAFAKVRLEMILENASPEEQKIFKSSYDMLTNPAKMGEVFKFMAFFPTVDAVHYEKYPVLGFPAFPKT